MPSLTRLAATHAKLECCELKMRAAYAPTARSCLMHWQGVLESIKLDGVRAQKTHYCLTPESVMFINPLSITIGPRNKQPLIAWAWIFIYSRRPPNRSSFAITKCQPVALTQEYPSSLQTELLFNCATSPRSILQPGRIFSRLDKSLILVVSECITQSDRVEWLLKTEFSFV